MEIKVPVNAFKQIGLTPSASNQDIMKAIMLQIKSSPERMAEFAEYQKILLSSSHRFVVEFLYYFDPDTLEPKNEQ